MFTQRGREPVDRTVTTRDTRGYNHNSLALNGSISSGSNWNCHSIADIYYMPPL